MKNQVSRPRLFQKTFLVADIKFEIILGMLFFKISNVDVSFNNKTLTWKIYTIIKALFITEQVQIVDLKEFIIVTLDVNSETFEMYMAI